MRDVPLSRRSALTAALLPALAAATPATAQIPASLDARLIQMCGEYIDALGAYDRDGGRLECDVCPLWQTVERLQNELREVPALTMAGVLAKASVAVALARTPDGTLDFDGALHFPASVVLDLLRLHDGEVPA